MLLKEQFIYNLFIHPGLKEYVGANPEITSELSTTIIHSKSGTFEPNSEFEDAEATFEEFYDATDSSSSDEDSDNEIEVNQVYFLKFRNNSNIYLYAPLLNIV